MNTGSGRRPLRARLSVTLSAVLLAVAAGPAAATVPDYALLDEALLQNVREGYVDYDGLKASPGFAAFLQQLAATPDAFDAPGAELAYYINAYNSFAIRGILDGRSPATRMGRSRFFGSAKFRLAGEDVTLDAIEKRLHARTDLRIHFALACASLSCPRLSNRAYLPATVDAQLEDATRRFVNDVTRNRFDIQQRTAFVSDLFDRFGEDFGAAAGSLPGYLARYVQEPATRAALTEGRLEIRHLPHDWELNGSYSGTGRE